MPSENISNPLAPCLAGDALCQDNLACLNQLHAVVSQIREEDYRRAVPPCDSGIGAHVRHILDHYDAFFAGLNSGEINYDKRERDTETQYSTKKALQRIESTREQLAALSHEGLLAPIMVVMDCGSRASTCLSVPSTGLREMQFLVSHTVHHDALIAAAAKALGLRLHEGFGVAPSTLRYADCGK
ncbi:MAG: DinB family protein [Pseudomonadota bacterium]